MASVFFPMPLPLYRWRNGGPEKVSDLPKSIARKVQSQDWKPGCWSQGSTLTHHSGQVSPVGLARAVTDPPFTLLANARQCGAAEDGEVGEPAEPPSPVWSVPQRAEVSVKGICQVLIQTDHITYSHPQRARGFTPSRVQTIPFSEMNATRCCPASPTSTGGPISPSPQLMARPLQMPQPAAPHSGSDSL